MPIPAFPLFPPFSWARVQPFVYREFMTGEILVEHLRKYISEIVIPYIDENLAGFGKEVTNRLNEALTLVTDAIKNSEELTDRKLAELTTFVNNSVQQIINNSIEVQDPVAAELIEQPDRMTHKAVDNYVEKHLGRVSLDDFSGADDTEKLQAAFDFAKASTQRRVVVTLTRAITISRTVVMDAGYTSLEALIGPITSTVTDGPAILVTNSKTWLTANTDAFIRGVLMVGPGTTTSVGIRYKKEPGEGSGTVRGVNTEGCEIRGFGVGVEILSRAYLLRFLNTHIWEYDIAVSMPSGESDYGENIAFWGCTIGTGRLAISQRAASGDMYFTNCSFDFFRQLCVTSGMVGLNDCHIEMRHTELDQGAIGITSQNRAVLQIRGGRLMAHYVSDRQIQHFFETVGNTRGCGIRLIDVETHNISCLGGYLCGGTGNIYTRGVTTMLGLSYDTIQTSPRNNRLIDPSFGSATGETYATVRDAFISSAEATSRTESPRVSITQIAPGRLVIKKLAAGSSTVRVIVPVTGDTEKQYGFRLTLTAAPTTGSIDIIESFSLERGYDTLGRPNIVKNDTFTRTTHSFTDQSYPWTISEGYGGDSRWDRCERPWASHYGISIDVTNLPTDSQINISGILIAPR